MDRIAPKVFVTDCEGPITKNDNAAELCESFIPQGDIFFRKISLYDDYLAEIAKKPQYKAGDTLKLILPFFKAFGVTNRTMSKFSRRNILMIPYADSVLRDIQESIPTYIVSTSYAHYITAVCDLIGFPFQNTYSTMVNIDEYELPEAERNGLKDLHRQIMNLPDFKLPASCILADIADQDRSAIAILDKLFWEELPKMSIFKIIEDVNPVGGKQKAEAVQRIIEIEETTIENIMYVGDSITDVEAFRLVKAGGGLALSFNGNDWAVREASFAITARNALPMSWLCSLFYNHGTAGFEDLSMNALQPGIMEEVTKLSTMVRKTVRTEKIGALG